MNASTKTQRPADARWRRSARRGLLGMAGSMGITGLNKRLKSIEKQLGRTGRETQIRDRRIDVGRLDYDEADLYLRLGTFSEFKRLGSCAKEPWTVQWIERHIGDGDVLYDVGANVGAYALVAAAAHPGARVVAFEPGYPTYASLCDNVVLNEMGDRIMPLSIALAGRTQIAALGLRSLDAGAAIHTLSERPQLYDRFAPVFEQPMLCFGLDELIERFELPFPTHVKLDVDGPELEILEAAPRTLACPELRTLMVEMEESQIDPISQLLAEHGLARHETFRRHAPGTVGAPTYGLFVREARNGSR